LTSELAEVVSAWPLGASLAAAAATQGLLAGRRRTALNEALHELRRPLQALALAAPAGPAEAGAQIESSVQMVASALERLEREINGDARAAVRAPLFARPLLESAVGRWRDRAGSVGAALSLRWRAGEAMVDGDRCELAQALDNLIVNAVEHGGSEIVVEARVCRGRLRVAVVDSGRGPGLAGPRGRQAAPIARISGRRRHGHGLRVVRRTAADHGGDFRLHRHARTTEAVLELPLLGEVELGR
jgi:signal transduction histidine kinase